MPVRRSPALLLKSPSRTLWRRAFTIAMLSVGAMSMSACSVLAVADAAVTVASTAVSVTATVVETTVDVAAAGVRAATSDGEADKPDEVKAPAQDDAQVLAPAQRPWQAPAWPTSR